jgi:hypothetical protein
MQTTTNTEETSMTDQQLANLEAELEELDAKPEKVAFRRAVREGATR